MARNALEAVFGALGSGLVGYTGDQRRRYEQGQDAMEREDKRLARELAARQSAEQRQIQLFQSGLEDAAPLRERARNVGQASTMVQAMSALPGGAGMPATIGGSAVAHALANASSGLSSDIARGRTLTVGDREYVQPYGRTPDGRAEREARQAASDSQVTAMRQAERDKQLAAYQMENTRQAGRNALAVAGVRDGGTGGVTGRGRVGENMPALPTVVRAATEVAALTREQVLGMDPSRVWAASVAPLLAAEPSLGNLAGAGVANMWANKGGLVTGSRSNLEPLYAQYIGGVSDAIARIGERVGVMTNQDIARYRALTTFLPSDGDEIKLRKWENLRDWAQFLVDMRKVAENPTPEAVAQLRERVATLGSGASDDEVRRFQTTTFNLWADENPKRADEDHEDYVARYKAANGLGGR